MINKFKLFTVLIFLACFFATNSVPKAPATLSENGFAKEEETLKGVWVATVFNLDFPNSPTTNSQSLKSDLDKIVKNASDMGFNTIFFQVRPSSDAFYKSDIFPWSKHLTGIEGTAPDNNFDPLSYLVDNCHKKGLKIHAWINPYRVTSTIQEKDSLSENSIANKHPEWIIDYNGKLYLNPGIPEVNDFVAEGAAEIVRKYDVDGVQIDDYFYPGADFPDDWSYSAYGSEYKDKSDWRRSNIDSLVTKLNQSIKKEKTDAEFGVSPQGIWANAQNLEGGSDTTGREAYFNAYADTRKWVKENMIDYIIPQIYWNIGYAGADFKTLLHWWSDTVENSDVKLYIGQAAYKVEETTDSQSVWYGQSGIDEITNQIALVNTVENVSGYSLYRLSNIVSYPEFTAAVTECNTGEKEPFYDLHLVPWAKDDIKTLYEKNILSGIGDGSFGVQNHVTRGQFAVMISRLFGKKAEFKENFADVLPDKYYYNDIGSLKALGFIQGISDTEFAPENSITRQDIAVIVYRILLKESLIEKPSNDNLVFSDESMIKAYAKEAVKALTGKKIINGYEDNSFKPLGNATRAEAAVIMNRILKLLN